MVETSIEAADGWTGTDRQEATRLASLAATACEEALRDEGATEWVVSLTLTSQDRVHELNRTFRNVDAPTDVLSFSQREGDADPNPGLPNLGPPLLGDVIVALEVAREQAQAYGHSVERETAFLAVHGTLHLLGYDHEESAAEADMMARGERALERVGLTRDDG